MPKSSSQRGIYDPDYRTSPWNRSQYAPKFTGRSDAITSQASIPAMIVFLLGLGAMWLIYSVINPQLPEPYGIYFIVGAVLVDTFIFILVRKSAAERILAREYQRLTAASETESKHPQPSATPDPFEDAVPPQAEVPNERFMPPSSTVARGTAFESEVAHLINATTRFKAVMVGGTGDGGVDLKLLDGQKLVGVVQCKNYSGAVPLHFVQALAVVKQRYEVPLAFLVTSGRFGDATRQEAERLGVRLIDGAKLEEMRQKMKQQRQNLAQG